MSEWYNLISGLGNCQECIVALLSVTPLLEMRVSIPYGIVVGVHPLVVIILSVLLNLLIIPLGLLTLHLAERYLKHIPLLHNLFKKYLDVLRRRSAKKVERWGVYALLFFLIVPLPLTGVFSSTVISWLFNMDKKKAIIVLSLGVIISAIIITALTYAGVLVVEAAI